MGKGKEIEVKHITKAEYEASKGGKKLDGGAELKSGYGALISGYEDQAANARQEANELARGASQEAERESAGKGADKAVGIGISNDGSGWKFGFTLFGDSKLDKYDKAHEREETAKSEIKELKSLANMGVKAEDVQQFMQKGLEPSTIREGINHRMDKGKDVNEAVKDFKKYHDLAAIPEDVKSQAAQLAKNNFGGQELAQMKDGTNVAYNSANHAAKGTGEISPA